MNNKTGIAVIIGVLLLLGAFVVVKNSQQTTQVLPQTQDGEERQEDTASSSQETGEEEEMEKEETAMTEESQVEEVTVSVADAGFEPQSVTVKAGTKVVWVNNTAQTTNVSSAKHPTHLEYPPLNLANFEPGESISLVFDTPGTYKYHDHLNPTKFGTVVVE